jgi:hypothetical protein
VHLNQSDRIAKYGEVFTSEREVTAMLDLLNQETQRLESRFYEPSCGNGNFLTEILRRKLSVATRRYKKSLLEYERASILAVTSIYGIDLLLDNVEECRLKLLEIYTKSYRRNFKNNCKEACIKSAQYIIGKNILHGDSLSLVRVGEGALPLTFSEWSPVNGSYLKRREFRLKDLVSVSENNGEYADIESDLGSKTYIAPPFKEHALVHFLDLGQNV